jgi:hypothetical protein
MKKLLVVLALGFISNSFSQKELFISSSITKKLNESRSQLNLNIFKNHDDLKAGIDFYSNQLILDNNIDIESISKKFKINIVSLNVYPVRYLNEELYKEQLQYIIDSESDNNLYTNDLYFYRYITVKKTKSGDYLAIVAYGTKMEIPLCNRQGYSEK